MSYSVALGGSDSPITQLIDDKKTSTTPGTAVQFATKATATVCCYVEVQALKTNTSDVVVGGSDIVAAPGTQASPTQKGIALAPGESRVFYVQDLSQLYLDVITSGDGVGYQMGR